MRVDPDLRYVLIKALVKMDDEPDNPHAMLFADAAFLAAEAYFAALLTELQRNYKTRRPCSWSAGLDSWSRPRTGRRFSLPPVRLVCVGARRRAA